MRLPECRHSRRTRQRRCAVTAFVRLLGFVPTGAAVPDQHLREVVLPGLYAQPGMRYAYAGRSGTTDMGPRMVASVWELDARGEQPPFYLTQLFPFEQLAEMSEVSLEVIPLVVSLPFESAEEPRILRVFRGQTQPGELDAYVEAARDGTYEDVMAQHGPAALFLGIQQPDRFVTVSVWTAWENIEAATVGNLRRPIATRHDQRLVSGSAEHYEIVPNSMTGPARPPLGG